MNTEIRIIGERNREDINLLNEPFRIFGQLLPSYADGKWRYKTIYYLEEEITEMCFPDYPYDYEEAGRNAVFIGAYEEDRCIGLAVLREDMFRYMYLDDLKVKAGCRGRGVGKQLIEKCMEIAEKRGRIGVYTIAQDNNLAACLFYLDCGFEIGGFDDRIYRGTPQESKANIIFYRDSVQQADDT